MIAGALLIGALIALIMLTFTAWSCVLIQYHTRRIMEHQETLVELAIRQDNVVSSDSSAHKPA
jgi:cell division protein FtsL